MATASQPPALVGRAFSPYLTVEEVAELAHCHRQTVRAAIHRGDLKAHRGMRARYLVHEDAARLWANARDGRDRLSIALEEAARLIREAPDTMVVYAVQAGRNGPVKIVRVTKVRNLARRLSALQTGSAEPLYLRRLIETSFEQGLEQELHYRFEEDRLEGEWFAPSPRVLEFTSWVAPP